MREMVTMSLVVQTGDRREDDKLKIYVCLASVTDGSSMSPGRDAEPSLTAIVRPVAECRQVLGVCYTLDGRSRQHRAGVACYPVAVVVKEPFSDMKKEMRVAQMAVESAGCLLGGILITGRTITR